MVDMQAASVLNFNEATTCFRTSMAFRAFIVWQDIVGRNTYFAITDLGVTSRSSNDRRPEVSHGKYERAYIATHQ